ncbi:hypothetical protein HB772_18055 [Sinorhizobium meliloti]|nr:hypothetical protein HB772_18055 [Sinorhizobium meliloti]
MSVGDIDTRFCSIDKPFLTLNRDEPTPIRYDRAYSYLRLRTGKKIRWQAQPQGRLLSGIAANEAHAIH